MNLLNFSLLSDLPMLDKEVEDNETKLLVPGYRQLNGYACGPVSVYSVVKTFYPKASYQKMSQDCNPSEDDGAGLPDLVRGLRRNGVGASERWGLTFTDIAKAIEKGFPIIVGECRNGEGSDHWCVITGYGKSPNRVFTCNQPNKVALSGREEFTWSDWKEIWDEHGFGLVCWGQALT